MLDIYKAIEALIVLHNICIDWGDKPEDIWDFDPQDGFCGEDDSEDEELEIGGEVIVGNAPGNADVPAHETDRWLRTQGRRKRQIILDELFPV
jgi:hypothetical protein